MKANLSKQQRQQQPKQQHKLFIFIAVSYL